MLPDEQQLIEELKLQIKDLENKVVALQEAVALLKSNGADKTGSESERDGDDEYDEKRKIWEWVQEGFNLKRIKWKHNHRTESAGGPAFAELGGYLI